MASKEVCSSCGGGISERPENKPPRARGRHARLLRRQARQARPIRRDGVPPGRPQGPPFVGDPLLRRVAGVLEGLEAPRRRDDVRDARGPRAHRGADRGEAPGRPHRRRRGVHGVEMEGGLRAPPRDPVDVAQGQGPDNARAQGFFGTLKCDFLEGRDWTGVGFEEFAAALDAHIERCRSAKIKKSLGLEDYPRTARGAGLCRVRLISPGNVRGSGYLPQPFGDGSAPRAAPLLQSGSSRLRGPAKRPARHIGDLRRPAGTGPSSCAGKPPVPGDETASPPPQPAQIANKPGERPRGVRAPRPGPAAGLRPPQNGGSGAGDLARRAGERRT